MAGQSIADYAAKLPASLDRPWSRPPSERFFPQPLHRADIPIANGGTRSLGIPTVAD